MSYRYFIGIDPGVNGAIAIIDVVESKTFVFDIPCIKVEMTTKTKKGKNKKRSVIDLHAFSDIISRHVPKDGFAVLEKVHATPQMGVSSAFNFGYAFGVCEMLLATWSTPYDLVSPVKWKKIMGLKRGANKEESRIQAKKMFPDMKDFLKRKADHNKAEALLLAEYARRLVS